MMNSKNKGMAANGGKGKIVVIGIIAAVLIAGFFLVKSIGGGDSEVSAGGDLKIQKSEVTEIAKFYPYKVGKTNMEVIAVKAQDGSIRTALNTCQVCFDSGRGYYEQQGDELVCQNCRNRFKIDQVEMVKGGCNPVPVLKENKTDDGTNIVISKDFLNQNKELFSNWGKQ
ncbi:MAG: DUF2318 domain-containing protein [Clostridia bacterium]|nr:DUF2318 domain-containing protein [Clostridia bacterium]